VYCKELWRKSRYYVLGWGRIFFVLAIFFIGLTSYLNIYRFLLGWLPLLPADLPETAAAYTQIFSAITLFFSPIILLLTLRYFSLRNVKVRQVNGVSGKIKSWDYSKNTLPDMDFYKLIKIDEEKKLVKTDITQAHRNKDSPLYTTIIEVSEWDPDDKKGVLSYLAGEPDSYIRRSKEWLKYMKQKEVARGNRADKLETVFEPTVRERANQKLNWFIHIMSGYVDSEEGYEETVDAAMKETGAKSMLGTEVDEVIDVDRPQEKTVSDFEKYEVAEQNETVEMGPEGGSKGDTNE